MQVVRSGCPLAFFSKAGVLDAVRHTSWRQANLFFFLLSLLQSDTAASSCGTAQFFVCSPLFTMYPAAAVAAAAAATASAAEAAAAAVAVAGRIRRERRGGIGARGGEGEAQG